MSRGARQDGFALLIVLWALGLLALLGTMLAATARQQSQRLTNLLDGATVEAAAEAALHHGIFALLDVSDGRWRPDGTMHRLRLGEVAAEVRIRDETGKVNPNLAPPELLQGLLRQVGLDAGRAEALAGAILDWRSVTHGPTPPEAKAARYAAAGRDYAPPGLPFESIDELGAVLGMTPALLARLRPHLSLFTTTDPDATTDDPVVLAALGAPKRLPPRVTALDTPRVAAIEVRLRGPGRTGFAGRAVVRTNYLGEVRRFEILARERLPPG